MVYGNQYFKDETGTKCIGLVVQDLLFWSKGKDLDIHILYIGDRFLGGENTEKSTNVNMYQTKNKLLGVIDNYQNCRKVS